MKKLMLCLVCTLGLLLCGCIDTKKLGREAVEGGIEAVESRLVELRGSEARKAIAGAMREGFSELDIDPNLDGTIDHNEYFAFQRLIAERAILGLASGKSLEEVKSEAISIEKAVGVSGGLSALFVILLNLIRNRSRRKDLAAILEENKK